MKVATLSYCEYDSARASAWISALEGEVAELKTRNVALGDELGSARREVFDLKIYNQTRIWY